MPNLAEAIELASQRHTLRPVVSELTGPRYGKGNSKHAPPLTDHRKGREFGANRVRA